MKERKKNYIKRTIKTQNCVFGLMLGFAKFTNSLLKLITYLKFKLKLTHLKIVGGVKK